MPIKQTLKEDGSVPVRIWTDDIEEQAMTQLKNLARLPFVDRHGLAVMPDVHSGKGSTIGTVYGTNKAIVPAAVGVDIGCFTSDTVVELAFSEKKTFAELIDEQRAGIKHFVYSINDVGQTAIGEVSKVTQTRTVTQLATVVLDNGEKIRATLDHPFMLRDGNWREAGNLTEGQSLMPFYQRKIDIADKTLGISGCHIVYDPKDDVWKFAHHLSDQYNYRHGLHQIPSENNKLNNDPTNVLGVGIKNPIYKTMCEEVVLDSFGQFLIVDANPKVVRVIIENVDPTDVYCLTVPEFGNFALGAGIIVKNCGMNAVRLSLKASDLPDSLKDIRDAIEKAIPLGPGGAHEFDEEAMDRFSNRMKPAPESVLKVFKDHDAFLKKAVRQIATIGSGNHFLELCLDELQDVWIMLHSGSRGTGNMIGSYYIEKAKKHMEMYFISLPDGDLAYLPEDTEDFNDYVEAVQWAQDYAKENRRWMMKIALDELAKVISKPFTITQEAVNCHHNFVEKENHFGRNIWVTRKGAIRARAGEMGIIPGSMGAKSFIVRGKGNLQSYCSCSHGAGRKMSRTAAAKYFTVDDLKAQTEGVECRKDSTVLDEIPGAYKDIDAVMAHQSDLIEIVHTLKQIMCIKGG